MVFDKLGENPEHGALILGITPQFLERLVAPCGPHTSLAFAT